MKYAPTYEDIEKAKLRTFHVKYYCFGSYVDMFSTIKEHRIASTFDFGKYINQDIELVFTQNLTYFIWLLENLRTFHMPIPLLFDIKKIIKRFSETEKEKRIQNEIDELIISGKNETEYIKRMFNKLYPEYTETIWENLFLNNFYHNGKLHLTNLYLRLNSLIELRIKYLFDTVRKDYYKLDENLSFKIKVNILCPSFPKIVSQLDHKDYSFYYSKEIILKNSIFSGKLFLKIGSFFPRTNAYSFVQQNIGRISEVFIEYSGSDRFNILVSPFKFSQDKYCISEAITPKEFLDACMHNHNFSVCFPEVSDSQNESNNWAANEDQWLRDKDQKQDIRDSINDFYRELGPDFHEDEL